MLVQRSRTTIRGATATPASLGPSLVQPVILAQGFQIGEVAATTGGAA